MKISKPTFAMAAEEKKNTAPKKKKPTVSVATSKTADEYSAQLRKVRRTAADKKPVSDKKSIAQKTARRKKHQATVLSLLALIPLGAMWYIFARVLPGYSFSALLCAGVMGLILFYNGMALVGKKFPKFSKVVTRIVSFILCLGLLVAAATEFFIIKYSFGSPREETPYILVLGAKVRPDGASVSLQNRIDCAYEYLTAHPDVIAVVTGGQGTDEPITEAQCMFDGLTARGIDPGRIWMEDKATSTWENLQFSLALIEEKTGTRPEKIGIISSEYHLFRASLFTRAAGAEFVGIPAHTTRVSQMVNHFLREIAGVWHYIILGSFGGHYHD